MTKSNKDPFKHHVQINILRRLKDLNQSPIKLNKN